MLILTIREIASQLLKEVKMNIRSFPTSQIRGMNEYATLLDY